MGIMKSGYILNDLDKQYAFTYDGELLQLVPKNEKEIKPYDCFVDMVVEKELLSGITIPNEGSIFFLKCRLQRNNSGYIAKPAGYICFDDSVNTFRTMVLKGEVINYFYRPNQILGEGSEYPWEDDGGGKLIIKKFPPVRLGSDTNNSKLSTHIKHIPFLFRHYKRNLSLTKPQIFIPVLKYHFNSSQSIAAMF